ncbi:hypothetical protein B0T17DRAFT_502689 [Bombardia bombarda]|uniref:F-box domain-containing protein n=1 Tax=Bombardia bombarda TaxID=252184 RepID=A0AA39XK22_9PEZI|nr:hypothetical protein B0T17DRAFT_502689 [Bombardia bombarda]
MFIGTRTEVPVDSTEARPASVPNILRYRLSQADAPPPDPCRKIRAPAALAPSPRQVLHCRKSKCTWTSNYLRVRWRSDRKNGRSRTVSELIIIAKGVSSEAVACGWLERRCVVAAARRQPAVSWWSQGAVAGSQGLLYHSGEFLLPQPVFEAWTGSRRWGTLQHAPAASTGLGRPRQAAMDLESRQKAADMDFLGKLRMSIVEALCALVHFHVANRDAIREPSINMGSRSLHRPSPIPRQLPSSKPQTFKVFYCVVLVRRCSAQAIDMPRPKHQEDLKATDTYAAWTCSSAAQVRLVRLQHYYQQITCSHTMYTSIGASEPEPPSQVGRSVVCPPVAANNAVKRAGQEEASERAERWMDAARQAKGTERKGRKHKQRRTSWHFHCTASLVAWHRGRQAAQLGGCSAGVWRLAGADLTTVMKIRHRDHNNWQKYLADLHMDGMTGAVPVPVPVPVPVSAQAQAQPPSDSHHETRDGGQAKRKHDDKLLASSPRNKRAKNQHDTCSHVATFCHLPPELHHLVFDQVELIEDLVCLGLTSRYFWAFARKRLLTYYFLLLGRWAGESIACAGWCVEVDDYPPGLLSPEEEDRFLFETTNRLMNRTGYITSTSLTIAT